MCGRKKLICLALVLLLVIAALAAPALASGGAGSAADPLMSQGRLEEYLEQQFAPLKAQLAALKARLEGLSTAIVLTIGSSSYTVNGAVRTMDTQPYVNSDGRTLVPVRFVAEALGAQVDWSAKAGGATDKVYITSGSTKIVLTIGSASYTVNEESRTMDTAPVISNSRTMVPVRFVAEALGCTVDWSASPIDKKVDKVYINK